MSSPRSQAGPPEAQQKPGPGGPRHQGAWRVTRGPGGCPRRMLRLTPPCPPGPARSPALGEGQGVPGAATPPLLPRKQYPRPPSPRPICPALCPLPSATPAGQQTMRAAGARRGGGTETAQNHVRPHLTPAGLRRGPRPPPAGASVGMSGWGRGAASCPPPAG